jgi:3-deoxy-D-manno-octulosonic-acid transferase
MSRKPNRPPFLAAYRMATYAAEPFAPLLLRARAKRGKEDPARLTERLGYAALPRPAGPLVWLHGVSVGEALSLLPLIEDLCYARPDLSVLVTSGTRTAAALLARRLPGRAMHQYLPVDGPKAARRFFDHWRPDLGVFVESELWPNLLWEARTRGVRMALLSAKLSDRSLRHWMRFSAAARALYSAFQLVLAQDEHAVARLEGLGVEVAGVADLKFGAASLPFDEATLRALRSQIAGRPVILAASTHPGEDVLILSRFAALLEDPQVAARSPLLAIAPRHPERGPQIAALAADDALTVSLQSAGQPVADAQVRVADAIGELGAWYRAASLAIVCGSLVEGVGGHNPLEPARIGCPIISGPHIDNWRSAYDGLLAHDAAALVSAEAMDDWIVAGVERRAPLQAMAERAQAFVAARDAEARGLAARLLALLP